MTNNVGQIWLLKNFGSVKTHKKRSARQYNKELVRLFFSLTEDRKSLLLRAVSMRGFTEGPARFELTKEIYSQDGSLQDTLLGSFYHSKYRRWGGFVIGLETKDKEGMFKGPMHSKLFTPLEKSQLLAWMEKGWPLRLIDLNMNQEEKMTVKKSFDAFTRIEYQVEGQTEWDLLLVYSRKEKNLVPFSKETFLKMLIEKKACKVRVRHLPVKKYSNAAYIHFFTRYGVAGDRKEGEPIEVRFDLAGNELLLRSSNTKKEKKESVRIFDQNNDLVWSGLNMPNLGELKETFGPHLRIEGRRLISGKIIVIPLRKGVKLKTILGRDASRTQIIMTDENGIPEYALNMLDDRSLDIIKPIFAFDKNTDRQARGRTEIYVKAARISLTEIIEETLKGQGARYQNLCDYLAAEGLHASLEKSLEHNIRELNLKPKKRQRKQLLENMKLVRSNYCLLGFFTKYEGDRDIFQANHELLKIFQEIKKGVLLNPTERPLSEWSLKITRFVAERSGLKSLQFYLRELRSPEAIEEAFSLYFTEARAELENYIEGRIGYIRGELQHRLHQMPVDVQKILQLNISELDNLFGESVYCDLVGRGQEDIREIVKNVMDQNNFEQGLPAYPIIENTGRTIFVETREDENRKWTQLVSWETEPKRKHIPKTAPSRKKKRYNTGAVIRAIGKEIVAAEKKIWSTTDENAQMAIVGQVVGNIGKIMSVLEVRENDSFSKQFKAVLDDVLKRMDSITLRILSGEGRRSYNSPNRSSACDPCFSVRLRLLSYGQAKNRSSSSR